jgi:hypothetical protein
MSNLSARDAEDKMFQANAPTTTVVSNSVLTNASKFVRENGGKCYPITWTFRDSTISTAKEAIFRSDCGSSRFALINVQTSGIPEVCYSDGDYAGWVRLVDPAPLKAGCKAGGKRQNSPVPLTAFARCQYTRKRNLAVRSDEKPFPAGSSSSGEFRT